MLCFLLVRIIYLFVILGKILMCLLLIKIYNVFKIDLEIDLNMFVRNVFFCFFEMFGCVKKLCSFLFFI